MEFRKTFKAVLNPIDERFPVKLVDCFPSNIVVDKYNQEVKIDVSKYFENVENVEIYQCLKTKYRFYYPLSIIGDGDFYVGLSNGKENYYHERWEHQIALKYAIEGEKWLEVGSGNSYFLRELSKRGIDALGLELNSEEVSNSKSEKFEVKDSDFFSFKNDSVAYDAIALFQVLEHMKDISNFFIHAKSLLKKNGKLVIGVPNNNPYLYVFDKYHTLNLPPHHMGLWTDESLKNVGENFGFKAKSVQIEPLSQSELNYILTLVSIKNLSVNGFKFFLLKAFKKLFPKPVFKIISTLYRKYLVDGRNVLVVFEKND